MPESVQEVEKRLVGLHMRWFFLGRSIKSTRLSRFYRGLAARNLIDSFSCNSKWAADRFLHM
jgi:hypothetical protein